MEHNKPENKQIENGIVREFQTPLSRRKRFFDNSDGERFYLETLEGGYKMPNRFCAVIENETTSAYFLFCRMNNERFNSVSILMHNDGKGFHIYLKDGEIWNNYEFIDRHSKGFNLIDVDTILKELNFRFSNLFNNFSITI